MNRRKTTKEILYEGANYDVPLWVNYIARDKGGAIWVYEIEPVIIEGTVWMVGSDHAGKRMELIGNNFNCTWDKSLQSI